MHGWNGPEQFEFINTVNGPETTGPEQIKFIDTVNGPEQVEFW